MMFALTLLLYFLVDETTIAGYPAMWYPILSALGISFLGNLAILFKWLLAKPEMDAKTSKINSEQLSIIIQDIQRVTARYSMLASKITQVEDDADRRLRLLRNIVLDGDEMAEKLYPILDPIRDANLTAKIREHLTKRRAILNEELAIENKRAEDARRENEAKL